MDTRVLEDDYLECDNVEDNTNTTDTPDCIEIIEQRVSNAPNSTCRSLFNIALDELDNKQESLEFKNYEARLHHEMKEWKTLYYDVYQRLKKSKENHPVIDINILPPEELDYIKKAPCLQSFLRGSIEFRQKAHIFMELTYPDIKVAIDNLYDLCERQLNLIKANKISELLANGTD